MPNIKRQTHKFDATGKISGRLATQVAILLAGKNKVTYLPNVDGGDIVEVSNCAKLAFTGNKLVNKKYRRVSGYPGGLTETRLGALMAKNPQAVFKDIVRTMLPNNKLRPARLKRLILK